MEKVVAYIVEFAFNKGLFPTAVALILLVWFIREWSKMRAREEKVVKVAELLAKAASEMANIANPQPKVTKSHKKSQKVTSRTGGRKR